MFQEKDICRLYAYTQIKKIKKKKRHKILLSGELMIVLDDDYDERVNQSKFSRARAT